MSNTREASNQQLPGEAISLTEWESVRWSLLLHLQKLVEADPRAAKAAMEMSQEHAPEPYLIAQSQPISQWPQSLMNSDSMDSLLSQDLSQAKDLLEQSDLRSLLELQP